MQTAYNNRSRVCNCTTYHILIWFMTFVHVTAKFDYHFKVHKPCVLSLCVYTIYAV